MSFWIDIKYAIRLLLKKPVFTTTSILIVAIGLALTLYTFSLLNQLIFKPLTFNGDSQLIAIEGEFAHTHGRGQSADPYHLNQISAESELLQGMSLYHTGVRTIAGLDKASGSRKVHLSYSQWNLFEVAGVQPILGRGFTPQDQDIGAESVIILSYGVWQNQFAGNKDIIGTTVEIEAMPKRVIGVMPEGFAFPAITQVWQIMRVSRFSPTQPSNSLGLKAVARLKQGISLTRFQQEMRDILQRHFQTLPQDFAWRLSSPGGYIRAFPFKLTNDAVFHHYPVFVAMLIVVLLILLLTCINLGNLLLVRVNERIKEVAIRISLGIPRKRLVLQMLWESIFICSLGGLTAFFLASWGVHITNNAFDQIFTVNGERPFWWQLSLDMDAIIVLLVAVVLMIVVTGFIPAWRALSGDLNAVLRDGTRGALGKKAGRANKLLVVTEISLSCVVLVVATMLLSTGYSAQNADYGVDTDNRITAAVHLAWGSYPWSGGSPEARKKRNDTYYRLKDELEQLPNIHSVAYFSSLPGTGGGSSHVEIQGKAAEVFNENPLWNFNVVSRDAWGAVGMKIIEGRNFDLRDLASDSRALADTESPVIINAAMARDLFPNGDAIGQRLRTVDGEGWQTEWRTVIGIVSDSIHGATMQSTSTQHSGYGLMDRRNWRMNIVMHYSGPQSQAEIALQQTINKLGADVTVYHMQSYDNLIEQPVMLVNAVNKIFLWCGLVALFLAASGIYAVAANSITLRNQEIATRRALGARNSQVIKLFLNQAGIQLLFGLALGISLSLWIVSQISQSIIINGNSYVIGLLGIPIFITAMVLTATYIPSSKIIKQEPSEGLRQS
ncbi:FtsX-like permease family protein [Thalassomonas actiniarum]|uniref:ABC transporter permease n=1 Tax=Thalassomonas actiniarum TaxID=485447 RepID=A0AAF0C1Y5_9GAMM|nr:FtsX-like permease family protein [Thalassomonas actiniarum]WDD97433.1 ABC transporter permease [Thalassomonas actiniarum]